jgi:hypothetical protein
MDEYILQNFQNLDVNEWLNKHSFKEETLIKLVESKSCNLNRIIYTQKVSKEFVKKYVLDTDEYKIDDCDTTISLKTIERCQGYSLLT